ncbi:MAG TPA: DUF2784 family protein [Candidatus Paceibacterota bacterium]|jgi:hypothetical protein|nr:DUF2784 family protein [Candidatus Paceibacterota bacterium]
MKKFDLLVANFLFVLHILVAGIILFGWLFPQIRILYLGILILWPLCWIFLGYCPFTKWEFFFRKKFEKHIRYHKEFIHYYMHKFFKINIPVRTIFMYGLAFDIVSILLNIFFAIIHS